MTEQKVPKTGVPVCYLFSSYCLTLVQNIYYIQLSVIFVNRVFNFLTCNFQCLGIIKKKDYCALKELIKVHYISVIMSFICNYFLENMSSNKSSCCSDSLFQMNSGEI